MFEKFTLSIKKKLLWLSCDWKKHSFIIFYSKEISVQIWKKSEKKKKTVIVCWRLSVRNESEMQLCRFKWWQPVWRSPYAASEALSRDAAAIMMDTQPLQTYSISVVFLMQRRAQPFLITSGGLSGTFDNSGTSLSDNISGTVVLYSSKGGGSSWFGQFNYSYMWWINHEYAMSVCMYSQRTMLVALKVWYHILRPCGGVSQQQVMSSISLCRNCD